MKTALTIAGSDSSGGAGIQADIKTMMANRVYAMSAVTALTAQNTTGVYGIMNVTPEFLKQQIDAVFTDIFPDAVKIGMVSEASLIEVIAERLGYYQARHIVVDPVMVSTSGTRLIQDEAVEILKKELFPLAELITPNIPEAEVLTGFDIRTAEDMEKAAEKIGINRYTIEQTSRDNVETMQLSQNGENGSVLCRFITIHQENVEYEQYLYIGVTLKNTVDASFTYEKLIRQIMEEMQIDTEVNVNLKGQIHGALTDTQKEQFAQDMLDMMNAKLSVGRHMEDVYTVYAYNKGIKNYIMIGKDKVNVNICIGYDEEKNETTVYLATPMNMQDY